MASMRRCSPGSTPKGRCADCGRSAPDPRLAAAARHQAMLMATARVMDHEIPAHPSSRPGSARKGADPHGRREHPSRQRQPLRPRLQRGIVRHCAAAERRGRAGYSVPRWIGSPKHFTNITSQRFTRAGAKLRRGPLRTRLRPDLRRTGLRRIDRRAPGRQSGSATAAASTPSAAASAATTVSWSSRCVSPEPSPPPRTRPRRPSAETRPPPARIPPPPPAPPRPAAASRPARGAAGRCSCGTA